MTYFTYFIYFKWKEKILLFNIKNVSMDLQQTLSTKNIFHVERSEEVRNNDPKKKS